MLLLYLLVFVSAKGCSKKRSADVFTAPKRIETADFLQKKSAFEPDKRLKNLLLRGELKGEGEGQSIDAFTNIIWLRDSAIWLNVKKFGIEGVRVLITPDSVYAINRIEQTYAIMPLEKVLIDYGAPGDFGMLERLLLGSAWFFPNMDMASDTLQRLHHLQGETAQYKAQYGIQDGIYRWRTGLFEQKRTQNRVSLQFDRFSTIDVLGPFAHERRIDAQTKAHGRFLIDINFTEIVPNGAETYRFDIPAHYRRLP
jgi:hypothetical protein